MAIRRRLAVALVGFPVIAVCGGCSGGGPSSTESYGKECKTVVSAIAANPISGYINLTGSFYTDETMQVSWYDGPNMTGTAHSFTATPATDRLQLTVGPFDSGQHNFYVFVSCTVNGVNHSDTDGPFSVTVN